MAPRLASRILISAAIGLAAGWYCHSRLRAHPTELAHDFTYPITAARHLLADRNPYVEMKPAGPGSFPEHGYFLYPLPAALVAMPLARIDVYLAGAIFFGASSALLAFGATRAGYWRLMIFLTAPYTVAAWSVQWSPLMTAVTLLPGLAWLGAAKPNLGIPAFAFAPRWSTVIGGLVLCGVAFLFQPSWLHDWIRTLPQAPSHSSPLFWPFGFLALMAVLRWRTAEARLLTTVLFLPVSLWLYDHLLLASVARNWRQLLAWAVASWAGLIYILAALPLDFVDNTAPIQRVVILTHYIPAAVIVLQHGNVGVVPAWAERLGNRLPAWLRGPRETVGPKGT